MATIELGCVWVPELLTNFERFGRGDLDEEPAEIFRRHFRVMPFENEDIAGLAAAIGVDRVLFGSDYPHTDGLAEPASFADQLTAFDGAGTRKIMRDNLRTFLNPRAAS
jgi:predicted TIM-barrel fold metal-dependent hydrolase